MDGQRMTLDLVDADWRPVSAELSIRRDTVEIRCRNRIIAVQDRDRLKAWLAKPDGLLSVDDVHWMWTGWAFSICVPGLVPAFRLGFGVVEELRRRLA